MWFRHFSFYGSFFSVSRIKEKILISDSRKNVANSRKFNGRNDSSGKRGNSIPQSIHPQCNRIITLFRKGRKMGQQSNITFATRIYDLPPDSWSEHLGDVLVLSPQQIRPDLNLSSFTWLSFSLWVLRKHVLVFELNEYQLHSGVSSHRSRHGFQVWNFGSLIPSMRLFWTIL